MGACDCRSRHRRIQNNDDLNEVALGSTQSFHKSLNARQARIYYRHSYLQIQFFD